MYTPIRMLLQRLKTVLLTVVILLTSLSFTLAQNKTSENDTIYFNTEPARGFKSFLHDLEKNLSAGDTVGRKHRMRLNNIGFFVSKEGVIDSAWVIFRPRPIHQQIITFLKSTPWKPAEEDGQRLVSQQEILDHEIYLTKAALKRHRHWRSLPERILSPWSN